MMRTAPATRRAWALACVALASTCMRPAAAADDDYTKWNPGHYMLVFLGDTPARRQMEFDELAREPAIKGAQVRYRWADLEPRKGEYDFRLIEADLARLQMHGKRLVIQIMDRGFNIDRPDRFVPEYLLKEPEYRGGAAKTKTGYGVRAWDASVMDREIALFEALGHRFDREPFVEAIGGEETAPSLGKQRPPDFNAAQLAQQLERWIGAGRAAWPHTVLLLYSIWLPSKLNDVWAACARSRGALGGPDLLPPPDKGTDGDRIVKGVGGGTEYRGRVPIAYAVQPSSLGIKRSYSPAELFTYAYDELHANYLFWIRNTAYGGPDQRWSTGILPFLRSIDGKIHTECPASLENTCRPGDQAR
jgi:hypothetical protein